MDSLGSIYGAHNQNAVLMTPKIFGCIFVGLLMVIIQFNGLIYIWPNFLKICNSLIIESMVVQLIVRVSSRFIRNDERTVQRIQKYINDFYEREEKNIQNRPILNGLIKNFEFGLKVYCIIGLIPICAPSISALIYSIVSKEYFLFVPFRLPFTDPENSLIWFIVHSLLLFFGGLLNGFILTSGDAFFLYFILQTIPMVKMITMKLKAFEFEIVNFQKDLMPSTSTQKVDGKELICIKVKENINKRNIYKSKMEIEKKLIRIIRECQEYKDYVTICHVHTEMTIFVAILMNSLSIGLAMLLAYLSSYTIGISAFTVFFIQILILCLLGSIVTHQNEKLLKELCSFPWYELSNPSRKLFLQHIHLCQNLVYLEIPIFGNLGMNLFAQIMNDAYAYLMYILHFVH